MNRRHFLTSLVAGAVLDPEHLLWVPGRKMISIPKPLPVPRLIRVPYTIWEEFRYRGATGIGSGTMQSTHYALASAWPRGRTIVPNDYAVPLPIVGTTISLIPCNT